MRTFVKISGITTSEIVALVPEGGAAGFYVEAPGSPRSLEVGRLPSLIEHLPPGAEAWAIVERPSAELVHRLFEEAGVDRIQVYGPTPEGLEFLELHSIVPSLPIPLPGSPGEEPKIPPAEDYARLHLDAIGDAVRSGSTTLPDWEVCHRLVDTQPGRKLTLAGGLSAENVAQALVQVGPWGVDVCAGVESAPGQIDPGRVVSFLRAVEEFERTGSAP